jgi:hypothetical protein
VPPGGRQMFYVFPAGPGIRRVRGHRWPRGARRRPWRRPPGPRCRRWPAGCGAGPGRTGRRSGSGPWGAGGTSAAQVSLVGQVTVSANARGGGLFPATPPRIM